ncbi:sugar phosphate isomerase/epimerase [Paenibacillus albicereus]|uniref:Sugar phosphate isomerase/epimerase n=1 Tax=Paenibacillus albicereus TaxID=2726185 RepID=A0A6H2H378_9BACL|nr:sugar phosphate isomerase/epimerase family protein [Paenibacillus albicereus]QJC54154.1 sugar phosphate isomerase/epimerase [Paenibacillus albicereus]
MQLSVFTVATPDLQPEELAAEAASAGLQGIEWRYARTSDEARRQAPSYWGNNLATIPVGASDEELARYGQAASSAGLRSISVTPYLRCGDLDAAEDVLAAARKLGASMIRLGVHGYDRTRPFGELYEEQRRYLAEAAALCRRYGVKGLVETHHGTIAPSASAAARLLEGLDPDTVGVLLDPGNMVHEGFENYRMGMELLGPYLAHVHMKNAAWTSSEREDGSVKWTSGWTGMRRGVVDWAQVAADLAAVGYAGWVGVEDFSGEHRSPEMLRQFAAYMRELLQEGAAR